MSSVPLQSFCVLQTLSISLFKAYFRGEHIWKLTFFASLLWRVVSFTTLQTSQSRQSAATSVLCHLHGHCSLCFAPRGQVASAQCGPISATGESSWFFHVFNKMIKLLISILKPEKIPTLASSFPCLPLHPISLWTQWKSLLSFLHLHFLHHCIACIAGLFSSLVIHVVFSGFVLLCNLEKVTSSWLSLNSFAFYPTVLS